MKLSNDTINRMMTLINVHEFAAFTEAARAMDHDLLEDGFKRREIITFLENIIHNAI